VDAAGIAKLLGGEGLHGCCYFGIDGGRCVVVCREQRQAPDTCACEST
jgi:hypothetical protein